MLRAALFLCTLGQAFFVGVASGEPSDFSLNGALQQEESQVGATETGLESGYEDDAVAIVDDDSEVLFKDSAERRRRSTFITSARRRRSFANDMEHTDWDLASKHIVDGMMKEFFQKASLASAEKECLDKKLGAFTGDIAGLVQAAVKALQPVLAPKEGEEKKSLGSFTPLLLEGVSDITDLIETTTTIMKNCLQTDGLMLLNNTMHKLSNFSYVEHQFLVNGVDIAQALAEGVVDFEEREFGSFGRNLGLAARKILLSTNNKVIQLPEGYATERAIEESSSGVAAGFFAEGSELIITDKVKPDVNIDIDLHQCVAENHEEWKDLFKSIWDLVTQFAANSVQHQLFTMDNVTAMFTGGAQPIWVQELILAFARFPLALTRCQLLDDDTTDMLSESISSLGSLKFDFSFPKDKIQADQATEKVAKAIEKFTHHDYFGFGKEFGKLFREVILLAFPEKYAVDESGHLRRTLVGLLAKKREELGKMGTPILIFGALGGVALLFLLSMVAMKGFRAWKNRGSEGRMLLGIEADDFDEELQTVE